MSSQFVTVATEFSPLKANVIRTRLEAEDIVCFTQGEVLASTVGPFSEANANWRSPWGTIVIQVHERDAERARAILLDCETKELEKDEALWRDYKPSPALHAWRGAIIGGVVFSAGMWTYSLTGNAVFALIMAGMVLFGVLSVRYFSSFQPKP